MLATRPNYRRAERKALEILAKAAIDEPPVNPVHIARDVLGMNVYFVTFEPSSNNVSGFFDPDDNAIVVNREEFPLRQTFTVAHELGHKVLHEAWARTADYKVLLRNPDATENDPKEKEANAFAANLLMPRFMMDRYWENISHSQLSQLFAVSVPAIKARISFLYGA